MKTNHMLLSVIALIMLGTGCLRDKDGDGPGSDATYDVIDGTDQTVAPPDWVPFVAPEKNAIVGQVVDPTGAVIEGVEVTGGGKTAKTNYEGFYALEELSPADSIVVKFSHPSYVAVSKTGMMWLDGRTTVNAVLAPRAPAKSVDPAAQTDLAFASGTVSVPAGAVVDSTGAAVTSPVMLRMTPVDVTGKGILAAPGDFSAVQEAGTATQLETFAMAEFAVVDEAGQPLQIKEGEKVTVEMLLPADTNLTEGEEVPAWHFDDATGKWVEEGKGIVQKYSKDETRLSYLVEVGHFSWWNCDKPMETTCVSGTVYQCDGTTPAAGADIFIQSDDYDGTSSGFGGSTGSFCVPARIGSTVDVVAAYGPGPDRLVAAVSVTTGSDASQCPGPCTQADIVLPCTPDQSDFDCTDYYFVGCKGCLKGKVVKEDGSPVPYAAVEVKTGNTEFKRLADAQGNYCTPAGLNAVTTIQARGAGASAGMITYTATQPGTCPSCEEVPDVVVKKNEDAQIISTAECVSKVGGVTLQSVLANGVSSGLVELDGGWGHITYTKDPETNEERWLLDLTFVNSASNGALYGEPYAHFEFNLQETFAGSKTYNLVSPEGEDTYSFYGRAASAVGDVVGLGNETYQITGNEVTSDGVPSAGTISFDGPLGAPGTSTTGSFVLNYQPDCAKVGSSLVLKGTFDLPVVEMTSLYYGGGAGDIDPMTYLQCSLISLYAWASNLEQVWVGAVQMEVDGLPMAMADGTPFGTARYSNNSGSLYISMYADDSVTITVENPFLGANPVTSASYVSGNCYYYGSTGTVTLTDFGDPTISTWWSGSFDVAIPETTTAEGTTCPAHTITGQFGAAVCVQ